MMEGKHNPLELIQQWWPTASTDHITYDPDMVEGEFSIIRGSTHDGTLLFSIQILEKVLVPVLSCSICHAKRQPPAGAKLQYTVGPVTVEILKTGLVDLPVGKRPGQVEQASMPVKVSW